MAMPHDTANPVQNCQYADKLQPSGARTDLAGKYTVEPILNISAIGNNWHLCMVIARNAGKIAIWHHPDKPSIAGLPIMTNKGRIYYFLQTFLSDLVTIIHLRFRHG